jgi:hypothetical protein
VEPRMQVYWPDEKEVGWAYCFHISRNFILNTNKNGTRLVLLYNPIPLLGLYKLPRPPP